MKSGKSLFRSKTFWTNVVALGASGLMAYGIDITPEDQAYLVSGVVALANIILRVLTKEPIKK